MLSSQVKPVVWTGFLSLSITLLAGGVWTGLLVANLSTSPSLPWSVPLMAILLWLTWLYLGGKWPPSRTQPVRQRYLRSNPVYGKALVWALIGGVLSICALAGLWIVIFQLFKIKGNVLPDFSRYPVWTVASVLIMGSAVSSVIEEAGFRGYFQTALERAFSAPAAIVIQCLLIALPHGLTQGFTWPTLLFYFCVDMMLGMIAYLTKSIRPGVAIHACGLLIFFTLVWPGDPSRIMVADGGADVWFWLHSAQFLIFTTLSIVAFVKLARLTRFQRFLTAPIVKPTPV